jgi:hypothetical protein
MNRSSKFFLFAAASIAAAGPAAAVEVGQSSVNFSNAVGGTDNVYTDADGITGNDVFRWGDLHTGAGLQNGFSFTSGMPGGVGLGSQFTLGTFRYENNPTYGTALKTLDLSLSAMVDGVQSPDFLFRLTLDQTENAFPCKYASSVPCSDALSVSILSGTGTFMANGQEYTLFIDGFRNVAGNFSSLFIGDEDTITTASIVGRFAPAVTPSVPEPASWAMMVGGFGLLGSAMRRRPVQGTLA